MILLQSLRLFAAVAVIFQVALLGFELSEGQAQAALGRLLMGILLLSTALLLRQMRFAAAETARASAVLRLAAQRWRWFWPAALLGVLVLLAEGIGWVLQGLSAGDGFRLWDLLVWIVLGSSLFLCQLEPFDREDG